MKRITFFPADSKLGLSLIELLVTIGILILLATLAFYSLGRARERGGIARCQSNLRQQFIMVSLYSDDHNQILPGERPVIGERHDFGNRPTEIVVNGTKAYGDSGVFYCPSDYRPAIGRQKEYSYYWNSAWGGRSTTELTPKSSLSSDLWYWHSHHWYSDPKPYRVQHGDPHRQTLHDGRINRLHGDGSVHWGRSTLYPPAEIRELEGI